jgi:hypothetical protein
LSLATTRRGRMVAWSENGRSWLRDWMRCLYVLLIVVRKRTWCKQLQVQDVRPIFKSWNTIMEEKRSLRTHRSDVGDVLCLTICHAPGELNKKATQHQLADNFVFCSTSSINQGRHCTRPVVTSSKTWPDPPKSTYSYKS